MKYVSYSLFWEGGSGKQPYEQVAASGASLDGGIVVKNGRYFGYINGTDEQCLAAIEGCAMFAMKEITEVEAKIFIESAIPTNTEILMRDKEAKYLGAPIVNEKGYIERPLITKPQIVPVYKKPISMEERILELEAKVVDTKVEGIEEIAK